MKGWLSIYAQTMKSAIASRMAYRVDYFISAFIMLLMEFIAPLVTVLIYRSGVSFPGWDLNRMLLIQGIFLLSKGIAFPFFFGVVWNTLSRVQEGTFDLLLIKPRPVLFLAVATGFDAEDLGKLAGGLILMVYTLSRIPFPGWQQWLAFSGVFLFSLLMLFAFAVIMAATGMKWVGNFRLYEIFQTVTQFGLYPRSIFTKGFQGLITWVIPVSLIAYYPAAVLLNRSLQGLFTALGVSLFFFGGSLLYWRLMISHYSSAGG